MRARKRKERNFYVERPAVGQIFESEHQPLYDSVHREEAIEEEVVDSINHKALPASNRYGNVSEAQQFSAEDMDEGEEEGPQHRYRPDSREDEDEDEDEEDDEEDDEDFYDQLFEPVPKPKAKPPRRANRGGQRRFASAQQLEKERQKHEQKSAVQALEVLVPREILDAVETLPAVESRRDNKLREDLSMMLLASNIAIKKSSPNIAVCSSNEVMVKQWAVHLESGLLVNIAINKHVQCEDVYKT